MNYDSQTKKCKLLIYAKQMFNLTNNQKIQISSVKLLVLPVTQQEFQILLMPTVSDDMRDKHCHTELRGALLRCYFQEKNLERSSAQKI